MKLCLLVEDAEQAFDVIKRTFYTYSVIGKMTHVLMFCLRRYEVIIVDVWSQITW